MAAKGIKAGSGDIGPEHVLFAIVAAVLFKVAVDELALMAEHGFDNWRRHRLGW